MEPNFNDAQSKFSLGIREYVEGDNDIQAVDLNASP